jgi:hypothetical protein
MASCSCWASTYRSQQCRDGFGEHQSLRSGEALADLLAEPHREAIAAMDFFTVPTLTFAFCTASSSSVTTGVEPFTST